MSLEYLRNKNSGVKYGINKFPECVYLDHMVQTARSGSTFRISFSSLYQTWHWKGVVGATVFFPMH